jgi:hypothetical protein
LLLLLLSSSSGYGQRIEVWYLEVRNLPSFCLPTEIAFA